ncbi:MAG: alkaline phosphatase family protein, partial [Bacteroidota bacterium]
MKISNIMLGCAAFVFFSLQISAQQKPPAQHVVLITIDGFRPDFYLDSAWHAMNIRALMKDGAYTLG